METNKLITNDDKQITLNAPNGNFYEYDKQTGRLKAGVAIGFTHIMRKQLKNPQYATKQGETTAKFSMGYLIEENGPEHQFFLQVAEHFGSKYGLEKAYVDVAREKRDDKKYTFFVRPSAREGDAGKLTVAFTSVSYQFLKVIKRETDEDTNISQDFYCINSDAAKVNEKYKANKKAYRVLDDDDIKVGSKLVVDAQIMLNIYKKNIGGDLGPTKNMELGMNKVLLHSLESEYDPSYVPDEIMGLPENGQKTILFDAEPPKMLNVVDTDASDNTPIDDTDDPF